LEPLTAALNDMLTQANVYDKLRQKEVAAWLDLRNKAVHGQYEQYDAGQVLSLIRDVRMFVLGLPA
jgi:hypothetical protein